MTTAAFEIGDKMGDGTIYLGRFKDVDRTERDWFAAANDIQDNNGNRLSLTFNEAVEYAKKTTLHTHNDWKLPPGFADGLGSPDILHVICANKASITGLNDADEAASWYWSSTPFSDVSGRCLNFQNGGGGFANKGCKLSVRLVRSVKL